MSIIRGLLKIPKEHFTVYFTEAEGQSVHRVRARPFSYYADPFVWHHDGTAWLFVEEFEYLKDRGRLCALQLARTGEAGEPRPILPLDGHASFPFLTELGGYVYMLPETCSQGTVDLFICEKFPDRWRLFRRLMSGIDAADTIIFEHAGYWWLITSVREPGQTPQRHMEIYFTQDPLNGRWTAHPINARRLYGQNSHGYGRNAGPIRRAGSKLLRLMQSNCEYYGQSIQLMQVEQLTPSDFLEEAFVGRDLAQDLVGRFSPHHMSFSNGAVAWDVRDRLG
jgi:hypothetical protein